MELPSHVRSRSMDAKILNTFTTFTPPGTPKSARVAHPLNTTPFLLPPTTEIDVCECCHEALLNPLTLECRHEICGSCVAKWSVKSYKGHVTNCPMCKDGALISGKLKNTLVLVLCSHL